MRRAIRELVASMEPMDALEADTIADVLAWIDSGAELCRIEKPATPDKHLVSYFPLVDGEHVLLVDHINAEKWLPTGGHVEPDEHPRDTALRECYEELAIEGELLWNAPVLITSTRTVGKTSGHTDVSIWYALKGDRAKPVAIDESEFREARWFHKNALPTHTDPHLARFVEKLNERVESA